MRALKKANFLKEKPNTSCMHFCNSKRFFLQRGINTSKRKWLTKISEKEICIINNNDHCSGLLRSGEGGSDKLVENRLPNLPVQKLCTQKKKKKEKKNRRILEHKQTNNNATTMNKKLTFRKFFS